MKNSLGRAALALSLACILVLSACTVDQVLSDIDVALEIAQNLAPAVGAVLPADGVIISTLTTVAINGVNAIKTTYDAYESGKTPGNIGLVQAAANALKTNLAADLAAFHISDPALLLRINNWANLIYSMIEALLAKLGGLASALAVSMTPESLQSRWSSEVCLGDTACSSLVKVKHAHMIKHGFWGKFGV